VQLPFIHTRRSDLLFSSIFRSADTYNLPEGDIAVRRTALRAGWEAITAHTYGYSISPEGGVSVGTTIEAVRRALDSYGDATTGTVDARAYLPGFARHHVVALRMAAGASGGNDVVQRTFLSGGPGPADVPLSFDAHALGLLRGFPADTFAGSHIAVANADYRFPIAWPERGHGTLPLFLRSLHAAVFVDAADVWTREFRAADMKTSAGLEFSADIVAGYALPLTVAAGIGWGHDGAGRVEDARTFYVRVGHAF
jgi:outer membrane protein assembly factor BamA